MILNDTRHGVSPRITSLTLRQRNLNRDRACDDQPRHVSSNDVVSTLWFLITGALLVSMALAGSVLKRLPLTASMFYLGAGALLGPWGIDLLRVDALRDARVVERLTEIVVIVSLFTAGLKLRLPAADRRCGRRSCWPSRR